MEERRLLLAVALSLVLLTAYQTFLVPPPPARPASPVATQTAAPASTLAEQAPAAVPGIAAAGDPVVVPAVSDTRERRVEAHGRDAQLAFSNRGARLLSWRVIPFKDARGNPEEMVQAAPGGPRPLDVETGDAALDARLKDALFLPSAEMVDASSPGGGSVTFEYADADVKVVRRFEVPREGYLVKLFVSVQRSGRELPKRLLWGPGIANPSREEMDVQGYADPAGVALLSDTVERLPADEIASARAVESVDWVGVEGQYFAALLVPSALGRGELRSVAVSADKGASRKVAVAVLDMGTENTLSVYAGPKDHHALAPLGRGMERVVPLGDWIGGIVLGLSSLLRWVHSHVGNYGWSIVVLTLMINLLMSPLRHYSIANGIKMAKLAPEMRVIQDRYRKVPALDPRRQEMQKEIGALYERHGMSMGTQMAVGCVPLLITMPFLIAFYRVLQVSIDLRGAPFLWIADLSQKDPLYLTPVLMGLSMFVMQKITPSAMDPAQQRVMMIMPLVLVVMFFAAPAGLNLYWLASNLCSIAQQALTLQLVKDSSAREKRKA